MNRQLPEEYVSYFESGGIRSGFADFEFGGSFELEELRKVDQFNIDIQIDEYAPGFIAFAGNGGGEVLAFDAAGAVYSIPLIGMSSKDAIKIAASWKEYAAHILS